MAISALLRNNRDYIQKSTEVWRVCRSLHLIYLSGVSLTGRIIDEAINKAISEQQTDGGWADVEQTIWCAALLKHCPKYSASVDRALDWLRAEQLSDGSWGYSRRDKGRIPITGLLLYLLPELSSSKSLKWLANQWTIDLQSEPVLTYKGAHGLMAFSRNSYKSEAFIQRTVLWLQNEQNEDGGWGPWKNQPIGSTAEYTGIALNGLLSYPAIVRKETVERAIDWLLENQLPSGLWPAHYIEEGSSWALFALVMGYGFIKRRES